MDFLDTFYLNINMVSPKMTYKLKKIKWQSYNIMIA